MKPLQLYTDNLFLSPYAMSVFVALHEKGLDFDLLELDLEAGEQHRAGFAELSRTQRVPTLVHGDFVLAESSAITEYLEEAFAQVPLYPRELQARATARQIQAWLRSDLLVIGQERSTLVVFCGQHYGPLSARAQVAVSKLLEAAQAWLADGREYLFGEWSIVDVDLALMLNRLILNGDTVPAALQAYAQRQWQRPSVVKWLELPRAAL
ncbi:glutathione transferase [Pseudomonas sp. MWU16-30317]|uniref:glutathione transferase n=1 Tax=Pseudomonas sp. MWU16-30317 TaxID=2878095 RepID=UPI001CFA6928|nr:glutathione transferase [Pseudomonas sp. MWU16-30317]